MKGNVKGRVAAASGAIIMDMEGDADTVYCLAFPDTQNFRKAVRRIPLGSRRALGLNVILVRCPEGSRKLLRPGVEAEIDLNSFDELFQTL